MSYEAEEYWRARYEHVALLRSEGLTQEQIGRRLGVTRHRIRQIVCHIRRRNNAPGDYASPGALQLETTH